MFPTDSRIAAIPSIWFGWLPRQRLRPIPDIVDHLEIAAALFLMAWLILLSTDVETATASLSQPFWHEPSRLYQATNGASRPAFQFTHHRTLANNDFSVFPQSQQTQGLWLLTELFGRPPINRIQPPTALQPFSTTQARTTFSTTVNRRSRANVSVYTAFPISTLVRHHGVLVPSVLFFSCDTCPSFPTIV